MAETLIAGETVKGVAARYDLIPSTILGRHRMARQGKLVLPNLDGMAFVPVEVEEAATPAEVLSQIFLTIEGGRCADVIMLRAPQFSGMR